MPKGKAPVFQFEEGDLTPTELMTVAASTPVTGQGQGAIVEIPVDLIDPNPKQPRKYFNQVKISELAHGMREFGFTSVIWVRRHPIKGGRYQLVYGERRWLAAKLVAADPVPRFTTVRCEIREVSDEHMREIGLIENIQREDLQPLEEAASFRELLDSTVEGGERAYSIRTLGSRIGKDPGYVQDRLFLLELPPDVSALYSEVPDLALRTLREVCKLPTEQIRGPLLARLRLERLAFEKVRKLVGEILQKLEEAEPPAVPDDDGAGQQGHEERRARPIRKKGREPRMVYSTMLKRDAKTLAPILEGWEQMIAEGDDEVKQLVGTAIEELLERCQAIQRVLQESSAQG